MNQTEPDRSPGRAVTTRTKGRHIPHLESLCEWAEGLGLDTEGHWDALAQLQNELHSRKLRVV